MAECKERNLRNRRIKANELIVKKSNRLREQNETVLRRKRTENNEEREEILKSDRTAYFRQGIAGVVQLV
jgi:vacuolar-type H+-ATPase subunit H